MQKFINIPGLAIKTKDFFTFDLCTEKKNDYKEYQQDKAIYKLYDTILNNSFMAAFKVFKPNKETQKGLIYILTHSIRENVKIQLSVFIKDYSNNELIAIRHKDINNIDDLKREIKNTSGQRWQIEKY